MQSRKPLSEVVTEHLLEKIFTNQYPTGTCLPSENQIGEDLGVSRLTVREAIKNLTSGNVVQIRRGVGTFIKPTEEWSSFDALLKYSVSRLDKEKASGDLIEVRRMVESGAAYLAAQNRTAQDLFELDAAIIAMEIALSSNNVSAFLLADAKFHDLILQSSKNIFLSVIFEPLRNFLIEAKMITSSSTDAAQHGIAWHKEILAAIAASDAEAARLAMSTHMDQVSEDIREMSHGVKLQNREIK